MNIWAVGDIHGRSDLLLLLLKKLDKAGLDLEKDKLIFLGDYIDRGPDSKGVLDVVMDLDQKSNVTCLLGNHDDFLIDAVESRSSSLWCDGRNGGKETLNSFAGYDLFDPQRWGTPKVFVKNIIPKNIYEWMKKRPLFHKESGFFFSHAPLPRENKRGRLKGESFDRGEYTWTRPSGGDEFGICRRIDPQSDGTVKTIGVCGHNKIDYKPRLFDHYYCIDTVCGCHPKGRLTAIECKSKTIIQANPNEVPDYDEAVKQYKFEQREWRKRMQKWGMF